MDIIIYNYKKYSLREEERKERREKEEEKVWGGSKEEGESVHKQLL
jgi:hypothetical protein